MRTRGQSEIGERAGEGSAGRVAVVFGAGGGIGRALVAGLCATGRYRAVHAGSRSPPGELAAPVRPFRCDLLDEASIAAAADAAGPEVDLVIIATGLLHDEARGIRPEKSVRMVDPAAMTRVFAVNAIGPAVVAKHFLPRLPRDRRSVFAAISAKVGSIGDNRLGGWHAYRASKAALNMLVANLAIELARSRPHAVVAALHPGTVRSPLSEPFLRGSEPGKAVLPETAAGRLLQVIDGLGPEVSGGFFSWSGERLPW